MGKVGDVFSCKACAKVEALYYGINDKEKAQDSLNLLSDIESMLQEFRMETEKLDLDKMLNIQIATQYKNAATQFLHLEDYFNGIKQGKGPSMDDETARKYVSNLHLIVNSFIDYAKEIDRAHKKDGFEED
ncbi:MAG: hypothetical protein JW825_01790 [Candidatus Methanofastidiosa archaeon]|nr:hypothetical protein [Candidatus Methanofastidiosa archaeon]